MASVKVIATHSYRGTIVREVEITDGTDTYPACQILDQSEKEIARAMDVEDAHKQIDVMLRPPGKR